MGIQLALLAHCLATVPWVRSLLPWCPDHPSPPRQTGRVTRSPQLYLAVGALAHHQFFVRNVIACVNRRDCDGTQAHEVGTHNSSWLLRYRDLKKCVTCVDGETTVLVDEWFISCDDVTSRMCSTTHVRKLLLRSTFDVQPHTFSATASF